MDALTALGQISQASSPFLLVIAVWAFAMGKVVPRWVHDASEKRAEEWRQLSETQRQIIDRALTNAERERPG